MRLKAALAIHPRIDVKQASTDSRKQTCHLMDIINLRMWKVSPATY